MNENSNLSCYIIRLIIIAHYTLDIIQRIRDKQKENKYLYCKQYKKRNRAYIFYSESFSSNRSNNECYNLPFLRVTVFKLHYMLLRNT